MHVRRALALAASVPLLLAACTEKAEPTPKIPDPTTSSSTPSPTETETAEAESAEDFIRRWVAVNTAMQNTGEVDEYSALSRKCPPCLQTAERIRQIYANGGFVRTDGWLVRRIVDKSGATGGPVLDLHLKSSPTEFKERAGAKTESLPGGDIVMRVRLSPEAPWHVVRLTQVPS